MYKHKLMKNKLIKDLCIIIVSFRSKTKTLELIKKLDKAIEVIIVENSQDKSLKLLIEKKYKNIKVLIPPQNNGFSWALNLAVKKTNKKYVMHLSTDNNVTNSQIIQLLNKANEIKNFGAITPKLYKQDYKDLIIHNNKTQGLTEVSFNDGCIMLMKKSIMKKVNYFDSNIFLYFEDNDYYQKCMDANLPIFMYDKVTIKHEGSSSIEKNLMHEFKKIRNWHFCWSKFYYFKKHHGYLKGLSKTFPNLRRSIKNIIYCFLTLDFKYIAYHYVELEGLLCSYLNLKPFYRISKNKLF
jgi:N-acetylglucosaminyl-diphospho-decaprenol L-rhamnosyltransferase